jgi:MFS family permease
MRYLIHPLKKDRLWLLLLVFAFWMVGIAVMIPHIQPVAISYFASKRRGRHIDCSGRNKENHVKDWCRLGTDDNVTWLAASSFVANTILGLAAVPVVGTLSDRYGRKPFFLLGVVSIEASLH